MTYKLLAFVVGFCLSVCLFAKDSFISITVKLFNKNNGLHTSLFHKLPSDFLSVFVYLEWIVFINFSFEDLQK